MYQIVFLVKTDMKKHEIVYEDLCMEISARLQKNVNILPTEAEMCRSYSVSRQTLRKALGRLKDEHVVTGRQGSGYMLTGIFPHRVTRSLFWQRVTRLISFRE